ncbi:MAG: long-chain fatty acid--CoA ligase, partial [Firmicutes bacterium]|nr:long-chain fatty acid--CoA ligase [Bacillota bacterium]
MKNKPYPFYRWEQVESIRGLLALAAKQYGDKDAYVFKKEKELCRKSFAEFQREAHALAAYFLSEGFHRQRIAILGENSYEWILAWFGIVLSGNIAVPIDRLLQPEQISFILGDTQASAIVYSAQYAEMAPASIQRLSMEELDSHMVWDVPVPDDTDKDEICLIIYTSGTTGIAK